VKIPHSYHKDFSLYGLKYGGYSAFMLDASENAGSNPKRSV